jgi:hypothetical protein
MSIHTLNSDLLPIPENEKKKKKKKKCQNCMELRTCEWLPIRSFWPKYLARAYLVSVWTVQDRYGQSACPRQ